MTLGSFADIEREFIIFDVHRDRAALQDAARDHQIGDGCEYFGLNETLEGARAVLRVVAFFCQVLNRCGGKGERDVLLFESLRDDVYLHADNLLDSVGRKDVEEDDLGLNELNEEDIENGELKEEDEEEE